jgi:alkanesulfonate monooxygenase SsuD/methylene tetrahydromethanopterin reductase-like flavin-dependent oxidoreductase (luciferase family)
LRRYEDVKEGGRGGDRPALRGLNPQATRNRITDAIGPEPDRARSPQHRALRESARAVVGSAKDTADQLEQRFVERACDKFVVAATHIPGAFEDFVRLMIPELQGRGLYHREYEGLTLSENLGLGLPQPGCWK